MITSPAAHILLDVLRQKDFEGRVPTVKNEVLGAVTPLPLATFFELRNNPNSANTLITLILSELGIGVNTYSKNKSK